MTRIVGTAVALLLALGLAAVAVLAQPEGFDPEAVALIYHKLSGDPIDLAAVASGSETASRASGFDRPDVIKAETARLRRLLESADPTREFRIRINDSISEYDHDRAEFSIRLFSPDSFVPVTAFGQQYQIAFVNSAAIRAIPMPKEQAREFDGRLQRINRQVMDEVRFRVIGKGDPSGAVTGERVVRAEIVAARLVDSAGAVVFTPNVVPSKGSAVSEVFNAATADVAGLRVGMSGRDLETTLGRLFGPPIRSRLDKDSDPRLKASLGVNVLGCVTIPGRTDPKPGAVCVTALLDAEDTVRVVRVERVFASFNEDLFRRALVARYGPVSAAAGGTDYALGWGPDVDATLAYSRSGPRSALTAYYSFNETFMSRGTGAPSAVRVVLYLVDAAWAAVRPS